ncbi:MAG: hypothetical protein E5X94_00500 [Mesorhizobium sp.]|uniref:hypothetical protein n=1 Tax=Mesorhizobium sp. TaxID=1871066 RepID=UPI0012184422|nr:hypothetical protein [Mesorhizobium sp.]TIN82735.1 MAG: hypothetical protein E5X97_28935 [Mesorhizobium sp.]TIN88319.1 MAG: hypothetical protein E5X94_00500 [Mesorhizobium sp.]TIO88596.1 MAG: hypothetical protein E5Y00_04775 [Mesorhizobium sp.]
MAKANYSHAEYLRKQREYRALTNNASTVKYERTKKGKLMRTYRNMQSRVEGILKKKAHLYAGLPILPRDDFYRWAMASNAFHNLYDGWVASDYQCGESPSVDRIDAAEGYIIGNMRWLTHRENSRLTRSRKIQPAAEFPLLSDAA